MSVRCLAVLAAIGLAALLLPGVASANPGSGPTVWIDDTTDIVTVTGEDTVPATYFWFFSSSVIGEDATFRSDLISPYQDPEVNLYVKFLEPYPEPGEVFLPESDYLHVHYIPAVLDGEGKILTRAQLNGEFTSDPEGTDPWPPQWVTNVPAGLWVSIVETGGWQAVGHLTGAPNLPMGVEVYVASDAIPEPGALSLLGLGLLAFAKRRK